MPDDDTASGATRRVEFHFQEGFSGQKFDLAIAGRTVATVNANTRFQTGLAHIEPMMLRDGEEVIIRNHHTTKETKVRVHWTTPFVTVQQVNGVLQIAESAGSPGYL